MTNFADNITKQFQDYLDQQNAKWEAQATSGQFGDLFLRARANEITNLRQQIPQLSKTLTDAIGNGLIRETDLNPDTISKILNRDPIAIQGINELISSRQQIAAQDKQLGDFRNKFDTQVFGAPGNSLQQALVSGGTNDLSSLNSFLGNQEATTFNTQLRPLIQMALGSRGLSDSGAQVELQSKALGQLEQARQSQLMDAALGYRNQEYGLERSDILGNIGAQNQALSNLSDIQRAGITMSFQRELEQQRENLARELASRNGGGGGLMGGLSGALGGGMLGFALGGPYGAAAGALGGGLLGSGAFGGGTQQNQQYGQLFAGGSSFFNNNRSTSRNMPSNGSYDQIRIPRDGSLLNLPY